MKKYDSFLIGHISKDINIFMGEKMEEIGGAVVASSYSAVAGGRKVGILTKAAKEDKETALTTFNAEPEDVYYVESKDTTSIKNEYFSEDRETRKCTSLGIADQYVMVDMPEIESEIYHLAGLIAGDYDIELIKELSKKGKIAVDVQGFLRHAINGDMLFKDWEQKEELLPYITYFKTDAAEAEVLTGLKDRKEAAKQMYTWGTKEIMITHNTEVLVYDGKEFYTAPLKPRNLSGRSGRGDTCFSAYITERIDKSPAEAIEYAAALVSLKMETPGPFIGTREDVEAYIQEFYKA